MLLWGLAGLGALLTLPFGITSGREYLGLHPVFSLMIWVGWVFFAWTFIKKVWHGFWGRPVYVYMWTTGILFFLWTFAEGHAYLLPGVREYPIADLQIQWKSCGTLVASFNQMVYGSLFFIGERQSGDTRVAQSRTAFAFFGIGLLNSFTNYVHHTYHLPQSEAIKWIAFLVSMLEIILLVKVFQDVLTAIAKRWSPYGNGFGATNMFLRLAQRWNLCLLTLAILISVPPLNALIHGTHVVMAHGMGSELAIDSYILLGVFAFLFKDLYAKREVHENVIDSPGVKSTIAFLNLNLVCLVLLLVCGGLVNGVTSYLDLPTPTWMAGFPVAFVVFGVGVGAALVRLIAQWAPLLLYPHRHRVWVDTRGAALPGSPVSE